MPDTLRTQIGQYTLVPLWLLRRCTDPQAIRLYCWLGARYANPGGVAWPSQQRLADDLGLSIRSVIRATDQLRDAGGIVTKRRQRSDGSIGGNEYTLVQVEPATGVTSLAGEHDTGDGWINGMVSQHAEGTSRSDTDVTSDMTQVSLYKVEPDPREPDLKSSKSALLPDASLGQMLEYWRVAWSKRWGVPCVLTLRPLDCAALGDCLRQLGGNVTRQAIDAFLADAGEYLVRRRHPIGAFLKEPSTYIARSTVEDSTTVYDDWRCEHTPHCGHPTACARQTLLDNARRQRGAS